MAKILEEARSRCSPNRPPALFDCDLDDEPSLPSPAPAEEPLTVEYEEKAEEKGSEPEGPLERVAPGELSLIPRSEDDVAGDLDYLNTDVEWAGLPKFEPVKEKRIQLVLSFDTEEQRAALIKQLGVYIAKNTRGTISAWWPPREREDLAALTFDFGGSEV